MKSLLIFFVEIVVFVSAIIYLLIGIGMTSGFFEVSEGSDIIGVVFIFSATMFGVSAALSSNMYRRYVKRVNMRIFLKENPSTPTVRFPSIRIPD